MAFLPYVTTVLAALLFYRLFTNWARLRKAPGPFLTSLTDLWRAWYQYNGKLRDKLLKLHQQHGPIVRYGVKSISISDPSVVDVVYGSRAGFIAVGPATYNQRQSCYADMHRRSRTTS